MSITEPALRLEFFDYIFEERQGFICIAWAPKNNKNKFDQKFFSWPDQKAGMGAFLEETKKGNNVWFGVNLFRRPERKRDFALPTNIIWADLDYCDPGDIEPAPQCRLQSSPRKFQAFWRLEEVIDPLDAQALAKRIAYAYSDRGADRSGWDIEQLLRVPYTYNYKYDNGQDDVPLVEILTSFEARLPVEVFEGVTEPTLDEKVETETPLPNVLELPEVPNILYAFNNALRNTSFKDRYTEEPESDWSGAMWQLINICFEVGMSREETFAIALTAKCNKYDRDNRPISYLWREIVKAELKQKQLTLILSEAEPLVMPKMVEEDQPLLSIINEYKSWAVEATDAVEEYHELASVILLSSLLSSSMYLKTVHGKVYPNLWGLILGESTLTRKTTAMKFAMEFVGEIDRELIVATDGSVEGVLSAIASRPGQVSIFYKDEISGFIDSINRKDYLAGMPETLTQLYDVPEFFTRRLRKETITITNPVFIFFGGGIRDKMHSLLSDTFILSGFLPRFFVVSGEADLDKLRPTGPMIPQLESKRNSLRERFVNLHTIYNQDAKVEIPDANTYFSVPTTTEVVLTDGAWEFFQQMELQLAKAAASSANSMVAQPTFSRLAWSCLKMAMLLAAARQEPKDDKITTGIEDIRTAAWYVQRWGRHTIDLIQNVGQSRNERTVVKILQHVRRRPGCSRSELSRHHHLQKTELTLILDTLIDRGQITAKKVGSGFQIYPI